MRAGPAGWMFVAPAMIVIGLGHGSPRDEVADQLAALGVDYLFTGHWHANRKVERTGLVEGLVLLLLRRGDLVVFRKVSASLRPPVSSSRRRDWTEALRAWAGTELERGAIDVHARARELLDQALLDAAMAHTGGRRTEAATRLGLGRNTLTRKLGPGRRRR